MNMLAELRRLQLNLCGEERNLASYLRDPNPDQNGLDITRRASCA